MGRVAAPMGACGWRSSHQKKASMREVCFIEREHSNGWAAQPPWRAQAPAQQRAPGRPATPSFSATLRPLPGQREPSPARLMAVRFCNCLVTRWQLVPGSPGSLRMVGETLVWSICLILQVADIERLRWQARGCRASALQSRQQPARKTGILVPKMNTLYSFCTHAIRTEW